MPLPVAVKPSRFKAERTAAPLLPSNFAVSAGVNESLAGSATGAASRRSEFNHSAALPASASNGKANSHLANSAESRAAVWRT